MVRVYFENKVKKNKKITDWKFKKNENWIN